MPHDIEKSRVVDLCVRQPDSDCWVQPTISTASFLEASDNYIKDYGEVVRIQNKV